MSVDGINASFQTNIAQNASGAHAAEGAKGLFMGHAVQVEASPASILADAAEGSASPSTARRTTSFSSASSVKKATSARK